MLFAKKRLTAKALETIGNSTLVKIDAISIVLFGAVIGFTVA